MMATMQTQWTWLHQLTNCMDLHMKHVSQHQQVSERERELEITLTFLLWRGLRVAKIL